MFVDPVFVSSDKVEELLRGLRDAKDQKGSVAILEDTVSKTMKKVSKDFFSIEGENKCRLIQDLFELRLLYVYPQRII